MMEGKDKVGPMFPRLHINDAVKGGPKAPPRNKMALYEQLSMPSQRSTHSMKMPPRHPSETQYSQFSDSTTTSAQAEPEHKPNEDDYIVPIFRSLLGKIPDTHINNTGQERVSPSYSPFLHLSSMSQTAGMLEHNIVTREDGINTTDLEEEKIYSSDPRKAPLSNHEVVSDLSDDLDSETSIVDVPCEPAVKPDDVVAVIGQKHFWKARRAIVNQQRVFAVQVFELHRLIEVQKLIAASAHLHRELDPSDFAPKAAPPNVPKKRKAPSEKSTGEIESLTKNSIKEKASSPHSYANGQLIGSSSSPSSIVSSVDPKNAINPYSNQPQGHQWFVPFMTPSGGLVYKPYPGADLVCPPPPQYHFPSEPQHGYFPPYGMPPMNTPPASSGSWAHPGPPRFSAYESQPGYFPPYGMPPMNTPTAFSGSWAQQMDPCQPHFSARESDYGRYDESTTMSKDVGVQASTSSNTVEGEKMLPLFPMAPADCRPEAPSRVIKAVARSGLSASESAARIFRSIQEERKQR